MTDKYLKEIKVEDTNEMKLIRIKRRRNIKKPKDFVGRKIKERIANEMKNECRENYRDSINSNRNIVNFSSYSMINQISTESFEVKKNLLDVVKEFELTDFEIVLLSIYLDKVSWDKGDLDVDSFLKFIALFIKIKSNEDSTLILNKHLDLNKKIHKHPLKKRLDNMNVSLSEINTKQKQLNQPFNVYCKKDYIDYNIIVDKILKMSVAYHSKSESNRNSAKNKHKPPYYPFMIPHMTYPPMQVNQNYLYEKQNQSSMPYMFYPPYLMHPPYKYESFNNIKSEPKEEPNIILGTKDNLNINNNDIINNYPSSRNNSFFKQFSKEDSNFFFNIRQNTIEREDK